MDVIFQAAAPANLRQALIGQIGKVTAQETRDGVDYVSVQFDGVEVCGVPLSWFEVCDE